MTADDLFARRLLFTVGKGGVGRTTVTVALALEAVRRGMRVLLIELEGARGLEAAIVEQRRCSSPPPGIDRLAYLAVDGRTALEEYLALIIPVRRLLKTIFSSNLYRYFVAAAPGLRELMTVGKIWFEVDKKDDTSGRSLWDLVLVDGAATGHSLQLLRMPEAAVAAFPTGLVHREALRIVELLRDARQTGIVVVTTAEEMPANETIEIHRGLLALQLDATLLVVNQEHSALCSEVELVRLEDSLARLHTGWRELAQSQGQEASAIETLGQPAGSRGEEQAIVREVLERAREEVGWAAINAQNRARLAWAVPLPTVALPFVSTEEFAAEDVAGLSRRLFAELEGGR